MNRAPTTIWMLRNPDVQPNAYVRTTYDDQVEVVVDGVAVQLSRQDARLLAKRLNQCLDATVRR